MVMTIDDWLRAVLDPKTNVALNRCIYAPWKGPKRGQAMRMNRHLLVYVERGTLHARVDDEKFHLPYGSILWVSPGCDKEFWSTADSSSIRVHLDIRSDDEHLTWFEGGALRRDCQEAYPHFHRLHHLHRYHKPSSNQQVRALTVLTASIFRDAAKATVPSYKLSSERCDVIEAFIRENITSQITAQDIADLLEMTPDYVTRLFTETYGVPPRQFIKEERLLRAAELLEETSTLIKTIAYDVGIPNVSLFCRLFHKRIHKTPSQYRKHVRVQTKNPRAWVSWGTE